MIDTKKGVRSLPLSELIDFLERKKNTITVDLPCIRVYAARAKAVMNRNGVKSGYVEIAYSNSRLPDEPPTYYTTNAFPTTDSGMIYFNLGRGNYISEPTIGNVELCFSPVPNIIPNPNDKGGGMSGSTLLGEYCNNEGIDYYVAKWNVKHISKIIDSDNDVRIARFVEAKRFIDDFGKHEYIENKFECVDFAIKMRRLANERGIKCGVVLIYYREGNAPLNYLTDKATTSHALNIFHTIDKGVFYVEPQMEGVLIDEPVIGGNYTKILNDGLKKKGVAFNEEARSSGHSPYIVDRRIVIW